MWIQENLQIYAEVMYVECIYGYEAMIKYVQNQMTMVKNRRAHCGYSRCSLQRK